MAKKTLREMADEAERRAAMQHTERPVVTEADLAEVIDVDAVDEYVAVTGEYPQSRDLAEGGLVDLGLSSDASIKGLGADIHAMPGHHKDERA